MAANNATILLGLVIFGKSGAALARASWLLQVIPSLALTIVSRPAVVSLSSQSHRGVSVYPTFRHLYSSRRKTSYKANASCSAIDGGSSKRNNCPFVTHAVPRWLVQTTSVKYR
jgi:hypothetical protein